VVLFPKPLKMRTAIICALFFTLLMVSVKANPQWGMPIEPAPTETIEPAPTETDVEEEQPKVTDEPAGKQGKGNRKRCNTKGQNQKLIAKLREQIKRMKTRMKKQD
ncbi:unnamed protein product, partial [Owenia fusiformis]